LKIKDYPLSIKYCT